MKILQLEVAAILNKGASTSLIEKVKKVKEAM